MLIADIILFSLAVIGMSKLIIESKVFSPIRTGFNKILPETLYELFECHQCMGVWCGVFCGYLIWSPANFRLYIIAACAGSFLASFAYLVTEYLESKIVLFDPSEPIDPNER